VRCSSETSQPGCACLQESERRCTTAVTALPCFHQREGFSESRLQEHCAHRWDGHQIVDRRESPLRAKAQFALEDYRPQSLDVHPGSEVFAQRYPPPANCRLVEILFWALLMVVYHLNSIYNYYYFSSKFRGTKWISAHFLML
jgi:hypothetical protein